MVLPNTQPLERPPVRPGSFASTVRHAHADECDIVLIGVPDDTGVVLNNGTPGAREGPAAMRMALMRYGVASPEGLKWPVVWDAGDVVPSTDLSETHDRVTEAVAAALDFDLVPVVIGGGHDLTLPVARAVARRVSSLGGIYLDAHLDVRETQGSGMPFRRLVEDEGVQRLDVIGLDPFVNDHEHVKWFIGHGGRINALRHDDEWPGENLFVSVDLDAIDSSQAPGVSARNPSGMSVSTAQDWARAAGACERVRCFDIMELCPPNDGHGRTARVAASLLLSFLAGFNARLGGRP